MTLDELIEQFRVAAEDRVLPFLWDDQAVTFWFAEAEAEAAIRGRLLHESDNAAVCQIPVAAGASVYPLHVSLYEIDHIGFKATGQTRRCDIRLTSREELDRICPDWRDRTDRMEYAIQSDTGIRLSCAPKQDGILYVEGYRLPLQPLTNGDDVPEINQAHHSKLVHWVLHKAFSVPDSETVDKDRAAQAERAFTQYFGIRPDSGLRRETQEDTPHHNQAFWM